MTTPTIAKEEWEKSKEAGHMNAALDKLMEMDGLEEVKREFLKLHALVSVGMQQRGSHIGER